MKMVRSFILFGIGGLLYYWIEIIWRGYSHWSMMLVGGLCFVLVGLINELFTFEMPLTKQMAIGAGIVTVVEFVAGCILNLWLGLGVWDYSEMPFNLLGQVCIPFIVAWFFLSLIAIVIDDYLRCWLFGEEEPHYIILGKRGT